MSVRVYKKIRFKTIEPFHTSTVRKMSSLSLLCSYCFVTLLATIGRSVSDTVVHYHHKGFASPNSIVSSKLSSSNLDSVFDHVSVNFTKLNNLIYGKI